ncbi:MAG: DUF192 domain-containing protein, partial [Nitrosotalea sp.]
ESDILDLTKSLFLRPGGQTSNFMYMLPIPLKLNSAYHPVALQFNNYTRNAMSAQNTNQTNSILVQIDKDTGILVNLAVSNVVNINGKTSVSQQSYKLIDTNKITFSNYISGTILIPSWVKLNAKFWSDGSITDAQFIQGVKYLIENNIVKIPPGTTNSPSTQMPSWVKDDANYWSNGTISNNEFAGALQYMISNGIIPVSSVQNDSTINSSGMPTGRIVIGNVSLDVEIANTMQSQIKGLQYHAPLSYSQGMLFSFPQPQEIPIWMKDMQFPIDIIWIDGSGNVLRVVKNAPVCTADPCTVYAQDLSDAQYVLEVASGFADKFGITTSSHMKIMTALP